MLSIPPANVPDGYALVTSGEVRPRLDLAWSDTGTWGRIQKIDFEVLGRNVVDFYAIARPVKSILNRRTRARVLQANHTS